MKKLIFLVLAMLLSTSLVMALEFSGPDIQVTLLNQDPDPVRQGDIVEVRLKVENSGAETADNVQIQISPQYPFSIYSGSSIKDIGTLRALQSGADSVIVDFKLKVDEDAAEGDNELEVKLRVGQDQWLVYDEDDFVIDIEDYEFPEIKVYVKDSTVNSAGQKGEVVLEIANTDIEDVKFLQLTLLPSADYDLLSASNYVYLGDVDSDDTESEEFEIYINPGVSENLMIPVQLEYEDSNEKEYTKEFMPKLRIFNGKDSKKFGLDAGKSSSVVVIVLAVLAVAIYFYWRRKRKKK
ncbi:COG1361 S-layer family protein [Nanoarchaeota archaeon]